MQAAFLNHSVRQRGKNLVQIFLPGNPPPVSIRKIIGCVLAELDYSYPNYWKIVYALHYVCRLVVLKHTGSRQERRLWDAAQMFGECGILPDLCGADTALGAFIQGEEGVQDAPKLIRDAAQALQESKQESPFLCVFALLIAAELLAPKTEGLDLGESDFPEGLRRNEGSQAFATLELLTGCARGLVRSKGNLSSNVPPTGALLM